MKNLLSIVLLIMCLAMQVSAQPLFPFAGDVQESNSSAITNCGKYFATDTGNNLTEDSVVRWRVKVTVGIGSVNPLLVNMTSVRKFIVTEHNESRVVPYASFRSHGQGKVYVVVEARARDIEDAPCLPRPKSWQRV